MISQFNMGNIRILKELGYEVHVACNFIEGNTCDQNSIIQLKKRLEEEEVSFYQIDFSRSISRLRQNLRAYNQVKRLMKKNRYSFIHCHSPIGGVVGRLAGWRTKTKVIYTAHGFHFYKGAPLQNWLLYYPIEVICSGMTDVLITINKEDYQRAQKKFFAKKVVYVPGVGVKLDKFRCASQSVREAKRKSLGIKRNEIMLLSIGELSKRKNHKIVIEALYKMKDLKMKYYICGQGEKRKEYEMLIAEYGLAGQVFLLGYRADITELCQAADLFIFPSLQEGLPVALMEAMASGIPVICSRIRGNIDLVTNEDYLFNPCSTNSLLHCLMEAGKQIGIEKSESKVSELEAFAFNNRKKVQAFSNKMVEENMKKLYQEVEG